MTYRPPLLMAQPENHATAKKQLMIDDGDMKRNAEEVSTFHLDFFIIHTTGCLTTKCHTLEA